MPGPAVVPFYPFLGEGFPTKTDYRKKGTLIIILTSLLQDLEAHTRVLEDYFPFEKPPVHWIALSLNA